MSRVLDARKQRAVQRSRRIVEAARDIVRDDGLDRLTIQAVLDRTRLSLRAFYERFAGKDELLLAVFEEAVKDAAALHEAESADIVDPVDRLHATVTGLFTRALQGDAAKQSVPLSREHLRLAEARPVELRYAMEPLTQLVEAQIRAGMDAGSVREADPRRLAVLIVSLVSAHIHAVLLGSAGELDADRSGDDLWTFCWRAIRADQS
ncbi:MAG: TetR/AcrR family transcriptional regulator [Gemmatimonadota bacterium]